MFLQQIYTSKYALSLCSCTNGVANNHTKTISSNEIPNSCFTVYIFSIVMMIPHSPYNRHSHLHVCTKPKSKLPGYFTLTQLSSLSLETQLVKKFPALVCSQKKNLYWPLFWAKWIQSTNTFPPNVLKIRFNIILSGMPRSSKQYLFSQVLWPRLCSCLHAQNKITY